MGETELLLERFSGTEAVSAPFEFRCTLLSTLETVDLKSLLRTPATISLSLPDGTERPFHAIFRSLTQAEEGEGTQTGRQTAGISNPSRDLTVYTAVLVPKIWFLGLDADCKIFQNMSVPDIVEKVLTDNGIRDFQFRAPLRDKSRYPDRDYCVQYRESSLNFISRLLEEEGIFYFFEHTASKHTIVFADNSTILAPCPGQPSASYSFGQEGWVESKQEGVINLERIEAAHVGKSTLTDYFFEKPTLNLRANLATDNEEVFDYPGKYTTLEDGERYVRVRLEERETAQFVVNGSSICRAFRPGYNFKLKNHYRADTNQEYFLTVVVHTAYDSTYRQDTGQSHSYKNQFQAIPKSVPFRPQRRAGKAGGAGAAAGAGGGQSRRRDLGGQVRARQSAVLLGPAGQEEREQLLLGARVADLGRQKLGLDDHSAHRPGGASSIFSKATRTGPSSPAASITPTRCRRIRCPPTRRSPASRAAAAKAAARRTSTKSASKISRTSEMLTIHAEKDMETTVEHDDTQTVQNNRTIKVDGTHTENIVKDTTITIDQGNSFAHPQPGKPVGDARHGQPDHHALHGKSDHDSGPGRRLPPTAMQSITLKVGANSIVIDQTGVTIKGLMVTIEGETITQVKGDAVLILKGGITMIN